MMFFPIRNEAEPERVPLRSYLHGPVVPSSVKDRDERLPDALDKARRHLPSLCSSIQNGRHVGLDFYDLLIEGGDTPETMDRGFQALLTSPAPEALIG